MIACSRVVIRKAEESDLDWIVSELKQFASEYGTRKIPFGSDEFVRNGLAALIQNQLFLIAQKGSERVGLIAGILIDHPFNPDLKSLNELFWWVSPAHRGSRAALMLLKSFVEYGEKTADWILCTIESHSPVNPKVLSKRGFRLQESNYLREVY